MATHLLDDVQQVCDHVVMIDAGQLVVAGRDRRRCSSAPARSRSTSATRGDELLRRRWPRAGLHGRGRSTARVRGRPSTTTTQLDALRDVVAELGLPLYRLTTRLDLARRRVPPTAAGAMRDRRRDAAAGAVYDRGYRPYDGPRGGRGAATFALYKASIRRALGLRRSWRQKVAPFVLLGIVTIPAIVNVGIGYVTRDQPLVDRIEIITYREYVGVSSALLLFVALVAPDVICPDRRQRVLPLMFARPLTGRRLRGGQGRRRSRRSCSPSRSCPRWCCSSATCS